eukprot:GGOE01048409.1.p2 GENE.GGOE01048409.1~~GGOE01048409.1.p2  ORF type:complete len:114 (+),score=11.70 GGOE01048409.1:156-497(+)
MHGNAPSSRETASRVERREATPFRPLSSNSSIEQKEGCNAGGKIAELATLRCGSDHSVANFRWEQRWAKQGQRKGAGLVPMLNALRAVGLVLRAGNTGCGPRHTKTEKWASGE